MDFVLVNPPRLKGVTRRPSRTCEPHLGLGYVAAALGRAGFRVRVIDADARGHTDVETAALVEAEDPFLVGLTAPTALVKSAARVAQLVKQRNPSRKTVIGGYHATVLRRETLEEFPAFDFAVSGDGEEPAVDLARACALGGSVDAIAGLAHRRDGTVVENRANPGVTDLDRLPFPAWELFPLGNYHAHYRRDRAVLELPVNAGRGCPGRCRFCARVSGGHVRRRSPASVLEEIRRDVDELGAGAIVFMDETFTARPDLVAEICRGMIREGLHERIYWLCQTRVDSIDRPLLDLMARAGCRHIALGIESGDPTILARAGKGTDLGRVAEAVGQARAAGIRVDNFFVLGLPGETPETIRRTVDFAIDLDSDFVNFFILVPYPGTEIFEMARRGKEGLRLLTTDWDLFGIQMGRSLELEGLSRAKLERAQLGAYLRFYLRPRKIRSWLRMVDLGVLPTYLWNVASSQLRALGRRRRAP